MSIVIPHIDAFAGTVLAPGDHGWDAARQAFNLAVDQRPAVIAVPEDAADVAAAVRFARKQGLQVAPQRTGHNAAPLGALDDVLLLKTDRLQGVEIDADARRSRVGAGAKWGDVVPGASELGLAALHGSTPSVSVAGYTLGGGLGWYARRHGLACNSVTAIELVTADGELVAADAEREPELFWALRGGGGNYGVVTAMELELLPVAEVYAGALFFALERSAEVLHTWHGLLAGLPEEMTSVGRILQFPPIPDIPEPLRGNAFAVVEAVHLGTQEQGEELLRPLRELGPAIDTFALQAPAGIAELHMDPPEPVPAITDSMLLDMLPAAALDELVAVTGPGSDSPLLSVELRHGGGALARSDSGAGALSRLGGELTMFGVGMPMGPGMGEAIAAQLALVREALGAHHAGDYWNFVERPADARGFFDAETHRRLAAVKAQVDPGDVIRANHRIAPAAAAA